MLRTLYALAVALVLLGALFTAVEARWPAIPGERWWRRRGHATDLWWWFSSALFTQAATIAAVIAAALALAVAFGAPLGHGRFEAWLAARHTWFSLQPRWAQAVEALVLLDLLGYWAHRALHGANLWKFHAVHHSANPLDWLSAVRNHPVNEFWTRLCQVVPLIALGFDGRMLAGLAPLFTLYALMLHANVRWSFGPLRYVLASPAFHRWHHTAEERGLDKNFSAMFPVWDLLFGTFYLPAGELPSQFGVRDAVPAKFFQQLVWPFKRSIEH